MNSFLAHWKSSLGGLLTISLSTSAAFLAPPMNTYVSPKIVMWCGAFQVIGKIWISAITQDADKVLATVPGKSEPQVVAAHPEPDDPAAKAVVP